MIHPMTYVAPCFLVASPLLMDPNFLHTVVLVVEHDERGAMGVVVNRALPLTLAQICAESGLAYAGGDEATAFRGGPVEPHRGIVLVRGGLPGPDDTVLTFTEFLSYRKDLLEGLLLDPEASFRLFLGYAGWGPDQLDQELAQGAWARLPVKAEWLMDPEPTSLWQRIIGAMEG